MHAYINTKHNMYRYYYNTCVTTQYAKLCTKSMYLI